MQKIKLQPVLFGDAKTYDKIKEKLLAYPEQVCNTTEAFEGLVMEFVPLGKPDAPVGALSEYYRTDGSTKFIISTQDHQELFVIMDERTKKFTIMNKEELSSDEEKVKYMKGMGVEFGIMTTSKVPDGYLQHEYRKGSSLHRMNKEWMMYYGDNIELKQWIREALKMAATGMGDWDDELLKKGEEISKDD